MSELQYQDEPADPKKYLPPRDLYSQTPEQQEAADRFVETGQ